MNKIKKWRELKTDPSKIKYKKIKLLKIISYPYCGNDVVECLCSYKNISLNLFIKIERSAKASFQTEVNILSILKKKSYYLNIPEVIEDGYVDDKKYIVLTKIYGDRLSSIFSKNISEKDKEEYLFKYGRELAKIHNISPKDFKDAPKRSLHDIPREDKYKDEDILGYISFLKENKPLINLNTFVHGDFHYANVYWENNEISGILDWEYGGRGFKEQDIAHALILRNTQMFMDNINDIKTFLTGYKSIGNYDLDNLKWCLINGYCHFYLMNKDDQVYRNKIKALLNEIFEEFICILK